MADTAAVPAKLPIGTHASRRSEPEPAQEILKQVGWSEEEFRKLLSPIALATLGAFRFESAIPSIRSHCRERSSNQESVQTWRSRSKISAASYLSVDELLTMARYYSQFVARRLSRGRTEMKLPLFLAVGLFSTLAAYSFEASAQGYPEKPVTIIVPVPAGGATDVVARVLGAKLSERLGEQFVIENRAGANGAVGTAVVAKAAADGYTLVMGGVNTHAMNDALMKKPLYDFKTDFAPIALTARIPIAIVTHPSLNVRNLADLVARRKRHPGH